MNHRTTKNRRFFSGGIAVYINNNLNTRLSIILLFSTVSMSLSSLILLLILAICSPQFIFSKIFSFLRKIFKHLQSSSLCSRWVFQLVDPVWNYSSSNSFGRKLQQLKSDNELTIIAAPSHIHGPYYSSTIDIALIKNTPHFFISEILYLFDSNYLSILLTCTLNTPCAPVFTPIREN